MTTLILLPWLAACVLTGFGMLCFLGWFAYDLLTASTPDWREIADELEADNEGQ
jgi:hypothetical protein